MSMFPHTVTLYNTIIERDPENVTIDRTMNYITILRGVLLVASKGVNVRASGLDSADAVNLYIPFDVGAFGADGTEKTYVGPMEFWNAQDPEFRKTHWTLRPGPMTYFVKGEAIEAEDTTFEHVSMKYDDVYTVTKADRLDFGGLAHFECGGN